LTGDLAGTIVKAGPNTTSPFPIGSKVFSQGLLGSYTNGGLQEYTVIDSRYCALVPKGISDTDAALFPINAFTSALALFSDKGLGIPFPRTSESKTFDYASQKLVIIGGGTNCGKLAVQMACIAGIGSIITVAGLFSEAELKSYGATHVIDRHASDLEAQIRALVGDELVYLYDTITMGDHTFGISLLSSSKKGTLAHLLPGNHDESVATKKLAGFEEKQIFGSAEGNPEFAKLFWEQYPKWMRSGEVKILKYHVIEGLDAEKINKVLDDYRVGKGGERYHVHL
jgi:NADPH2:quinone reductase